MEAKPDPATDLLTYRQACALFSIKPHVLYGLRRRGLVETVELPGQSIRWSRASLERVFRNFTKRGRERPAEPAYPRSTRRPLLPADFRRRL